MLEKNRPSIKEFTLESTVLDSVLEVEKYCVPEGVPEIESLF
jgi:hypothetical protein